MEGIIQSVIKTNEMEYKGRVDQQSTRWFFERLSKHVNIWQTWSMTEGERTQVSLEMKGELNIDTL